MRTTKDIQNEIIRLKKERDVCILAHAYQTHDILEVADFVGDSFALSKLAAKAEQKTILMCGVRFMAETAKILSPEKKVLLSNSGAGCPMAEQLTAQELKSLRQKYPGYAVVAYINTITELKCECDVCVTSASALDVVKSLPEKDILFIPDCNLGSWLAKQLPEKNFKFIDGGCPVHMQITPEDVHEARKKHPDALLLVHPECKKEVTALSDFAGSTTGIMKFAGESTAREFIIGTDNSIVAHLQFEYPDKKFYPLSKNCVCKDMRLTTLVDVYDCVRGEGGEEIVLSDDVMKRARVCIDKMLG
ncbi:MAG: quinolinate synthase NadA [Oscillospiraceae bacterium]|nr:quinolinate synthase NadA [Oscillospiraceae bacterium]